MADLVTEIFNKGIYNISRPESIPQSASSESLGFISTDDLVEMARGRAVVGSENVGKFKGLHVGYKANGSSVLFKKSGTTISYFDGVTIAESNSAIDADLIARYKLDEDTNNTTVVDFTGTQSDATSSVDTDSLSQTGKLGKAFNFDGASKYVNGTISIPNDTFSVSFWINPDDTSTVAGILNLTDGTKNLRVFFNGVSNQIEIDEMSGGIGNATVAMTENEWQHICFTWDKTDLKVYKNGVLATTVSAVFAFTTLTAFELSPTITNRFSGKLDDVRFYNVELDQARVTALADFLYKLDWVETITGLDVDNEPTFTNYTSLAGYFTYIGGRGGLWKICTANPGSFTDVYEEAKNFKGKIKINDGRTILWNRLKDSTGLYGSKIDPQDGTVYTTVSAEAIGALGSTNYTGTLAFKGAEDRRTCFGVVFTDSTETFSDDYSGGLTGDKGGTGTINYMTGVYNITFNAVSTGAVTADYQYEDSNDGGVTDFTKSSPRQASEGFIFRQDIGGDPIQNVLIQDGVYYSIKDRNTYQLTLTNDDTNATNLLYRQDIGLPNWAAATETSSGIIFMNTANPEKPNLTTLQKTTSASTLEPIVLIPQFDLATYNWDDCYMTTYGEHVVFTGKTKNADNNDRLFIFNTRLNIIDVLPYDGKHLLSSEGILYMGSSVNQSVSKVLNGFDDDGSPLTSFWTGRAELFGTQDLKRIKRFGFRGLIAKEQYVEVFISVDDSTFEQIGTIRGNQSYVDLVNSNTVGSSGIGTETIGGGGSELAFQFEMEMKFSTTKFRNRKIKFVPKGIGYFAIEKITDKRVATYENRLPKKYRLKQNVSLDGTMTDQ